MSYGLRTTDGTAAIPHWSFADDTDSGFYRIGADNLGLSLGGTKRWDFAAAGSTLTGTLTVSGATTLQSTLAVTGAVTLSDTLAVTGAATFSAQEALLLDHATVPTLRFKSVAGADRAYIQHDASSQLNIFNVTAGGPIRIGTEGVEKGRFTSGGIFAWGTAVTTNGQAGDVVVNRRLMVPNQAGTGLVSLILRDGSSDAVYVGNSSSVIAFGNPPVVVGASAGEGVFANAKALRGVTAAGTSTHPLVRLSSTDRLELGGGYAGTVYPVILGLAAASLQVASAAANGSIALDTTNNRLVYYSGGARYYLTGTSF